MRNWSEDPFNYGADMFDSREASERIDFLVDKADDVGLNDEEQDELDILSGLRDQVGDNENFDKWGMSFISDNFFEDYAIELAEDVGDIQDRWRWPFSHIDWKEAADELKGDYSAYDVNGTTYWSND